MEHDTAGDPITGLKMRFQLLRQWSRRTTRKLAEELTTLDIDVSKNTAGRLLKKMDFKLRVNRKMRFQLLRQQIAATKSPDRNQQFLYIGDQRERFTALGLPVISVDAKKKELIGNFKNGGAKCDRKPIRVNDRDFRSEANGLATPLAQELKAHYGIYDMQANRGSVFVGTSHDTPTFAVDTIMQWWIQEGRERYPDAQELFILADGGGSNGSRCRAWKKTLQENLCTPYGLTVTVSHYPPGTSKWNPIEHRLFSQISGNWAGEPLTDIEKILKFISTTKTTIEPALAVKSYLIDEFYETGIKISAAEMDMISLTRHDTLGQWNYTLRPAKNVN